MCCLGFAIDYLLITSKIYAYVSVKLCVKHMDDQVNICNNCETDLCFGLVQRVDCMPISLNM